MNIDVFTNYLYNIYMELKDFNVFVCVPGVGKTFLASQNPNFVDLDSERAVYKYGLEGKSQLELEKEKYNRGEVVRKDSTDYVMKRLHECISQNKIVLLAPNPKIVNKLVEEKIPYCYVYHSLDCIDEYKERMRNRGNEENFISEMLGEHIIHEFYKNSQQDQRPALKIELQKGQFLSDLFKN